MAYKVKKDGPPRPRAGKGRTRLSAKNQATIPVDALRKAGLSPGDILKVRSNGSGRIVLERAENPLEKYIGCAPEGAYPPGYLEELRAE